MTCNCEESRRLGMDARFNLSIAFLSEREADHMIKCAHCDKILKYYGTVEGTSRDTAARILNDPAQRCQMNDGGWKTCSEGPEWDKPVEAKMANGSTIKALFRTASLRWENLDGDALKPLVTHWRPLK